MRNILLAGLAALALGSVQSARAGLLFQSIPDLTADPYVNAWCSSCNGSYQVFDMFTLGSASTIQQIKFDVQTDYHFPTDVTIAVYSISSGMPANQLASQTVSPSSFTDVNTPYDTSVVTADIPNWSLPAGSYDITFYNPNSLGVPGYSGGSGKLYQAGHEDGSGFLDGESAGFALYGSNTAVPEPAGMTLFGLGLLGIGLVRRSRASG